MSETTVPVYWSLPRNLRSRLSLWAEAIDIDGDAYEGAGSTTGKNGSTPTATAGNNRKTTLNRVSSRSRVKPVPLPKPKFIILKGKEKRERKRRDEFGAAVSF